jgi:hypothetical protein
MIIIKDDYGRDYELQDIEAFKSLIEKLSFEKRKGRWKFT